MSGDFFLAQMQSALMTVLIVSAPALIVAIAVGVSVGVLQALTQIQDQTLPQAIKLVGVLLIIVFLGPALAVVVTQFADRIFDSFAAVTR